MRVVEDFWRSLRLVDCDAEALVVGAGVRNGGGGGGGSVDEVEDEDVNDEVLCWDDCRDDFDGFLLLFSVVILIVLKREREKEKRILVKWVFLCLLRFV